MTTTTKFFATCDANGLIGAELESTNLSDAKRELAAAIEDRSAVAWIDDAQTDLEDELGISCDGLTYDEASERLSAAGADCEVESGTTDGWSIWSVTTPGARIFRGDATKQVDNDGRKADPELWYYEPTDYDGDVLWSKGYGSRAEAYHAAGGSQG